MVFHCTFQTLGFNLVFMDLSFFLRVTFKVYFSYFVCILKNKIKINDILIFIKFVRVGMNARENIGPH